MSARHWQSQGIQSVLRCKAKPRRATKTLPFVYRTRITSGDIAAARIGAEATQKAEAGQQTRAHERPL